MADAEGKIVYFEKPGMDNTDKALTIAKMRAKELGIRTILVASTRGDAAVRAVELLDGFRVIIVTHATGMRETNTQEFTEENRKNVQAKGGIILTVSHAFRGGASAALRKKFNLRTEADSMADTLRIFGQGLKVAVEISMMAADAGVVRTDEPVIAIGGTVRGADTAVVLNPANTQNFFDMRVNEILCKPH